MSDQERVRKLSASARHLLRRMAEGSEFHAAEFDNWNSTRRLWMAGLFVREGPWERGYQSVNKATAQSFIRKGLLVLSEAHSREDSSDHHIDMTYVLSDEGQRLAALLAKE